VIKRGKCQKQNFTSSRFYLDGCSVHHAAVQEKLDTVLLDAPGIVVGVVPSIMLRFPAINDTTQQVWCRTTSRDVGYFGSSPPWCYVMNISSFDTLHPGPSITRHLRVMEKSSRPSTRDSGKDGHRGQGPDT